jgi:predicted TIM-barrel fold metal-dependent hydrolase
MVRYGSEPTFESAEGYTMSDIEELRSRLNVVEVRLTQLSVEAASARQLAAMADREVAEIRHTVRAHTRVLNALRETQVEHGATLATLVAGQTAIIDHLGIRPDNGESSPG